MSNKSQILRALDKARIKYKASSKLVHIHCVFHKDKKTKSLVIYFNNTSWYCFGCKAHGEWEALAEVLKLGKIDRDWKDPLAFQHFHEELKSLIHVEPCLPPHTKPWTFGVWRSYNNQVLGAVRSLWWWDPLQEVRRIVWPVWDTDEDLLGWVGRDIDNLKDSPLKYRNMPDMKVLSTLWPWPININYQEKCLVLVEGITDALKLLQSGIPALATLGTSWSQIRTVLVSNLDIDEVVLAFDPDKAGRDATFNIGRNLRSRFSCESISIWEWPDKLDPGDAKQETIEELKREVSPRGPVPHPWLDSAPQPHPQWFPK